MKKLFYLLVVLVVIFGCSEKPKTTQPSLVLWNGKIWTAEDRGTFVEAIAITGNTISAVGQSADIKKLIGDSTRVINLKGRLMTPGFNDAHIHFLSGSLGLAEVELTEMKSAEEVLEYLKKYIIDLPNREWITGRGWQYTFYGGGLPNKKILDEIIADRPVYVRAYDGHSAWVNSKALALAGIDKQTKFTGFGEIVRDANGEPTGILKEAAMGLVSKLIPPKTKEENLEALRIGLKLAARLGITSIQNASGNVGEAALYEELLRNNELTVRTSLAFSVGEHTSSEDIQSFIQVRDRIGSSAMLRANAIKFMIDGVIEGHTAFMLDPYSDQIPKGMSPTGQVSMPLPTFNKLVGTFDSLGFQIYTHAIGDRGVRESLNAYEQAMKKNGVRDSRHRVEHIETINPEDIPRFANLNVMASMEPIHAEPGAGESVWEKAVGKERILYSFAWSSLLKAKAKLVYSSDWPACVSLNPIRGLHVAVTRQNPDGIPEGGWFADQKISIADALLAYTKMGAYSSFEENNKGQIKPGYLADVVVLSQDLFTINPSDTYKTKVVMTVFNGKVIFEE